MRPSAQGGAPHRALGANILEDPNAHIEPDDDHAQECLRKEYAPSVQITGVEHGEAQSWAVDWGRLLRTARQVSGLSLLELSTATGLSKGYLSKLEAGASGAANPSRATLAALARTLPSFRPLAHTLEPGMGMVGLDYSGMLPDSYPVHSNQVAVPLAATPIQLGWREVEAFMALLTLEAAAVPLRVTAPILARATGRDMDAIVETMDHLGAQHLVATELPARAGGVATYRCTADALARIGVTRLGDLLVLAAALIAGAPARPAARQSSHLRQRDNTQKSPSTREAEGEAEL